jgi:DNA-binding transcriptional ArsR family regulator
MSGKRSTRPLIRRRTEDLAPVWRALANPLRRRMLDLLRTGPLATGDLADRFPKHSRFAVMQHLRVLEEGGLVVHRRAGRRRLNYLNPVPIQQIYHRWVSQYAEPWAESLVALKGEVERSEPARARRRKTGTH